jgi:hypothetical protein
MSTQPLFKDLFSGPPVGQPLTGADLRDSGIAQAYMNAPDDLELQYIFAANDLKQGDRLTSEDLRRMCGDPPSEFRNCLAGVLKFCQSIKLIQITGETRTAERKTIHAKALSVYVRLDTVLDREWIEAEFTKRKERAKKAEAKKREAMRV